MLASVASTASSGVRPGIGKVSAQTPVESSASESTKRLTIEVPASLHHAIMVHARVTGVTAKDEITPLLRQHYADALKRCQR